MANHSDMPPQDNELHPKRNHDHTIADDDAAGLAAIGKTQAFDRRFGFWTVLGIGICVSGTVSLRDLLLPWPLPLTL